MAWHPLIWACKEGNTHLVEALLERKGDVNEKESGTHESGFTGLMHAAYHGHNKTVDLLLDLGADPTTTNNAGRTAASLAEMKGFKMIADMCTYVASQVEASKSKSIGNVAARALLVKQAASNFKGGVSLASEKVRFDESFTVEYVLCAGGAGREENVVNLRVIS